MRLLPFFLSLILAAPCWAGASSDFTGTKEVVTTDIAFGGTAPITVMAWVKSDSTSGNKTILSQPIEIVLRQRGTLAEFILNTFGTDDRVAGGTIGTTDWHCIAGSYDEGANSIRVYVDSVLVDSTTPSGTYANDADNFEWGRLSGGIPEQFDGRIAHGQIWQATLLVDEIREACLKPGTVKVESLVQWITFMDQTFLDLSGNGNGRTLGDNPAESADGPPTILGGGAL
jgi:hypothetical protein